MFEYKSFNRFTKSIVYQLVLFFCLCTATGFAQTDVPDPSIDPSVLKQSTQENLQNYLRDKNQLNSGEDIHGKRLANLKNNSRIVRDSTGRDEFVNRNTGEDVYGTNLFKNNSILELAELSTPPLDYPIGVGDHIIVSLWGGADFETDYIVARDGSIFPQNLGKITVQGLTFENARNVITDRFRRAVPASTNISVTMGQPRSIVVNVSGEVNNPGPVVVSAFSNGLNVIALSGGLNQYGNMRNIIIRRNGRQIDSIDVYRYLTRGDFGKHLYLENNDFIIIPFYDKKVLATGQFKRPMYYQLKKEEGLKDLIRYAGGFTPDAYSSGTSIIRTINERQQIKNVNLNAIGLKVGNAVVDEHLNDGDIVSVAAIVKGLKNKVVVKGEVTYPNVYELRPGDKLFDIINRAGGVTPNAFLQRAYIYKKAGDSTNIRTDKISVDLTDLNQNALSNYNVPLEPNDIIEIFSISQFSEAQMVSIEGEVRNPRKIQKYGGMTLKDLLYFANGLKPSAEFGRIEVSSIVDIDSAQKGLKPTKTVVKTYNVNANLELDSTTEHVILKPYDQVFVRKNPTFEIQQNVFLQGEIKYPGTYSKLHKNEHLSELITRAGGLKETANASGAILYRTKNYGQRLVTPKVNPQPASVSKSLNDSSVISSPVITPVAEPTDEPISIDLYNALKYKFSKYDPVLQEGDIIFIPEVNPVVSVKGTVQSPLKIYFDKSHTNLPFYIDKAGGFGIKPWKKRIFVTYADGKSKRTKNFGFFHFYPKIEEGAVITVPTKPDGKNIADFAQQALVTTVPVIVAYFLAKILK
ncbi:SLBB domain-containing protein [soil metagenome]